MTRQRRRRRRIEIDVFVLLSGPVLVQTPRAGYAASLACDTCRAPARCSACTGPLVVAGPTVPPQCRWCGHVEASWSPDGIGTRFLPGAATDLEL